MKADLPINETLRLKALHDLAILDSPREQSFDDIAQVAIAIMLNNDWVRISVHDRGPGIADEFKARIFQKFSQADLSDSRLKGGTGLGLCHQQRIN